MDKYLIKILENKRSWDAVSREIKDVNKKDTVLAGRVFEHLCKHYYKHFFGKEFSNVWLFQEIPSKVRSETGLSGSDYGIDLLIKTAEKKYIAVQCKFRSDEDSTIYWSKDKLANLFAEGSGCDHFIIFTNAAGVDEHSLEKYRKNLTVVTYDVLSDSLNEKAIRDICLLLKTGIPPQKKLLKPYPFQEKAVKQVISGLKRSDRGKLILPCGAGKTLTALWIRESLKVEKTLVLVPSLALLRQFSENWKGQQAAYTDYLCVCSERDIDKGADSNVSHVYELQAPNRVTTEPEVIRDFIRRPGPGVIYSTYQSSPQIALALKGTKIKFDLAICDEAHKTAGERKKSSFATILDDNKIPCRKRLFMTATPRVVSDIVKNRLGNSVYEYLADMNDPDTYGPELYSMTFAEAIEKGILVDYKIIAVGITDGELREHILERKYAEDTTLDEIANNLALNKAMGKYGCRHAVSFHSSVKKAQKFRDRHSLLFKKVDCFHINGQKTTKERKELLRDFKLSPKALVTNARCLTEGVDVPAIDAVYFCDPKYSKIDIVQASGRALRQDKEKDKKFGHIIIPIYHAEKAELEEHMSSGAFSQLVRVVRAMADQDARIEEEIRQIAYGEGERKPLRGRVKIDVGKVKLIQLSGFDKKLESSIFFDVVKKSVIPFRLFEQAREFTQKLDLSNQREWHLYCSGGLSGKPIKPEDIPADAYHAYKSDGWIGWGDWLGTGRKANQDKKYQHFEEAREFVHKLKLKSREEWREYCQEGIVNKPPKPDDIPADPGVVYKYKGWKGFGDWLGTGQVAPFLREYRPFEKAREFVCNLKLKSTEEWQTYCRGKLKNKPPKPKDIPIVPYLVYKDKGWKSWGDWLGTGRVASRLMEYRPFKEARMYVSKLKLESENEWRAYCLGKLKSKPLKPTDIPATPSQVYKDNGWKGSGDWLGTGRRASQLMEYRPFKEARMYVGKLKLVSVGEWKAYCLGKLKNKPPKPTDIPATPSQVYKDNGWKGFGDWIGTGRAANFDKKYISFKAGRSFAHRLHLKSVREWQLYCRGKLKYEKPDGIPVAADRIYRGKGWKTWGDWLGTGREADRLKKYISFAEAREHVHRLKLKSQNEWFKYCRGELKGKSPKPSSLPVHADRTYKGKGWKNWGDWLGKK